MFLYDKNWFFYKTIPKTGKGQYFFVKWVWIFLLEMYYQIISSRQRPSSNIRNKSSNLFTLSRWIEENTLKKKGRGRSIGPLNSFITVSVWLLSSWGVPSNNSASSTSSNQHKKPIIKSPHTSPPLKPLRYGEASMVMSPHLKKQPSSSNILSPRGGSGSNTKIMHALKRPRSLCLNYIHVILNYPNYDSFTFVLFVIVANNQNSAIHCSPPYRQSFF